MTKKAKAQAPEGPFSKLAALRDDLAKAEEEERKKSEEKKSPRATPRGEARVAPRGASSGAEPPSYARTDEEAEGAYRRLVAGTTPMGGRDRLVTRAEGVAPRAFVENDDGERASRGRLHALVDDGVVFEAHRKEGRVLAARRGTPNELKKRLFRGGFPIDATLDLHGLMADVAKERVREFLVECRGKRERCVKIVHGHGRGHPGGGVLRDEVFDWLTGAHRGFVEALATALPSDGGEGATLVLLARR